MHAEIRTVKQPDLRVKIVEERGLFEEDPSGFRSEYDEAQGKVKARLIAAQQLVGDVEVPYDMRVKISEICSQLDVDGLRGDIVTNRAAKAMAALEGRTEVTVDDLSRIIVLCLRHRLRKDPMETIDSGDKVKDVFMGVFGLEEDEE